MEFEVATAKGPWVSRGGPLTTLTTLRGSKGLDQERLTSRYFNPITYCILMFRQLRGGGKGGFLTQLQKTRSQLTD